MYLRFFLSVRFRAGQDDGRNFGIIRGGTMSNQINRAQDLSEMADGLSDIASRLKVSTGTFESSA